MKEGADVTQFSPSLSPFIKDSSSFLNKQSDGTYSLWLFFLQATFTSSQFSHPE